MDDTTAKNPAYRVLARKYRPRDFSTLLGQEPMVRTLTNAFETGRIAQAWMLTGVRGVGKTTTARILARALNFKNGAIDKPSVDLSEPGEHCQAIMEGRHVDIIEMDAASHTGIEDIKQIIDGVRYAPVSARYKVYIIDEIHMLSEKAFNALLKTLEEPPPHAKFIFATTEIRKVPITVLSRCQRFDLRRIEPDVMIAHLKSIAGQEDVSANDEALALIARAGEGSVRDALSIMDQAIAHGSGAIETEAVRSMLGLADRAQIVDLFEHVMAGRVAEAIAAFRAQYDVGADPVAILTDLADFTHLVTRLRYVPQAAEQDISLSPDERERGSAFAKQLPVTVLARAWQMLLKGIGEVESATRRVAAAEMVIIRIGHAATLPTLDDALEKLQDAPSGGAPRPLGGQPTAGGATTTGAPSGGGATAVSHGAVHATSSGGATMRLVVNELEPATVDAAPDGHVDELPAATETVTITSLHDLADFAEKHNDKMFRAIIRHNMRPVSFGDGRIEISLVDGADRNLSNQLSQKLKDWTGRMWMVSISAEPGGATLEEEDRAQRDALLEDAGRDPVVSAYLNQFPGARVIDVRLDANALANEPEMLDGEAELPVDPDTLDD
ncbi:MAG: DNA polymerase III subunit gamma/tau [Ahrensia sp.]